MIDTIMALFPAGAAFVHFLNLRTLFNDKKIYGVSLTMLTFFTTYAAWMIFYFGHNGAWLASCFTGVNFIANLLYLILAIYYKRRQNDRPITVENT